MKGAMVSVATGVMDSVLEKLTTLLREEFSCLHTTLKRDIAFLNDELSLMNALLEKLADLEELDPEIQEWKNQVREMAYDIEDFIDEYMHQHRPTGIMGYFHVYVQKVKELACHRGVAQQIQELKNRVIEANHRRKRYKLDTEVDSETTKVLPIDPRLHALYVESFDLVGIDIPRDHLVRLLDDGEQPLKVISIVGLGGLGKTTLANEAYKKISRRFDCCAFVSVSQKPDVNKIMQMILSKIKNQKDTVNTEPRDLQWLIDAVRDHLKDKRYFIVIDDVWDTEAWKTIKCALLENTFGSRILVTTRIATIAKSCCSPRHGTVYELRPLSEADSMSLFYARIFGSADQCPVKIKDVATDIIKKCGGLPLAIITMASLMATKSDNREEWVSVRSSIGLGLEDYNVKGMERILSLSYRDLPYHLKTCLLYLSMYPEDYEIDMHHLVRRWIAEGFVKVKSGRNSMDEGKSYFNELINRSLIQPVAIGLDGQAKACRVHDMVLDLIVTKAVKEKFITSIGDQTQLASQDKVRRVSLDYRGQEIAMPWSPMIYSHLRSLSIFGYSEKMLPISSFRALRMFDLESNVKLQNCYLNKLGDLLQLRYLRIAASGITRLPEQIGELQFLETLDLCRTWIRKLPTSIAKLHRLNFLSVNGSQLFDGVGNMQSLVELSGISVYNECSINSLQQLGSLTSIRTLGLTWHISNSQNDRTAYTSTLALSLGKLVSSSLKNLRIIRGHGSVEIPLDSWSSPPHFLRELDIPGCCFQMIPRWMTSMANLYKLHIRVKQVKQEDLRILGYLPALLDLELRSEARDGPMEMLVVCDRTFQCLKIFRLYGPIMDLQFEA